MNIGKAVFLYKVGQMFTAPIPGTVTGAVVNSDTLVDVNGEFPKLSQHPAVVAFTSVTLCRTAAEAREAFAKGARMVAGPRDTNDPVPFGDEEVHAAPAPKPKTKA